MTEQNGAGPPGLGLRVALVSWESLAGPAWTELAVVVSETARALSAAGVEVHLFTTCAPGQSAETEQNGVCYHRCGHDRDLDAQQEAASFGRSVLSRLRRLKQGGPFHIVHGFEWPAAWVLGKLRSEGSGATVWSFLHSYEDWRPPRWVLDELVFEPRWSYSPDDFADQVIAPHGLAKDAFVARWGMPPDRVEVVHPGVDPDWARSAPDPAHVKAAYGIGVLDPTILFIGHLTREARADLLVDAMVQVLEGHPQAKLVIAGDGEMAGFLEDRSHMLGVEGAVRLPGELGEAQLAQLCASCDVVCLPQRSSELLPPLLNAWAAGKPVVTTRSHSAASYLWHEVTGYISDDSADGLAAGLLWLFQDFDRCRWVGKNGRRAVEEVFGWPAIAGRLIQLYRQLVGGLALATAAG